MKYVHEYTLRYEGPEEGQFKTVEIKGVKRLLEHIWNEGLRFPGGGILTLHELTDLDRYPVLMERIDSIGPKDTIELRLKRNDRAHLQNRGED